MKREKRIALQRKRRDYRIGNAIRQRASGRLRLSVHRTNKNMSAQIIDDLAGRTVVAASSQEKSICDKIGGNCAAATVVGKALAERALESGIQEVAFDRGRHKYHGRVAALADAAREGGLKF
jgi:large subunit ribosomal protein L18